LQSTTVTMSPPTNQHPAMVTVYETNGVNARSRPERTWTALVEKFEAKTGQCSDLQ